jgi:hypothetical protein
MQQNMDGKKEREERKKLAIDHEEEKSTLSTRSARAQHEISIAQWLKKHSTKLCTTPAPGFQSG